jgi:hypothetical protein
LTAADRAYAEAERQGLPPTITDPAVLSRITVLLGAIPTEIGVRDAA